MASLSNITAAAVKAELFTETATVTGVGTTIAGMFEHGFVETLEVTGHRPVFTATTADLSSASVGRGTGLTISGTDYTVAYPQNQGDGLTQLILEET